MHKRQAWLIGVGVAGVAIFAPDLIAHLRLSWQRYWLDCSIRRLEADKQQLTEERERLTSDPVYVEGLIRSTFKVAKPNELVIPLPVGTPEAHAATRRSLSATPTGSGIIPSDSPSDSSRR